jgi:hypothetical protein
VLYLWLYSFFLICHYLITESTIMRTNLVVFICTFLLSSSCYGQYILQGTKLLGTGVVLRPAKQGQSVAISADGNTAVVGGNWDNFTTDGAGAVWVFVRNGETWTQQGPKLTVNDASTPAELGFRVGISNDGNTIIAGGPSDNNYFGAAWIFTRNNGVWTQQGTKLVGNGVVIRPAPTPSNPYFILGQGWDVAISGDGNTALISSFADTCAWVFTRTNNSWSQQGPKFVVAGGRIALGRGLSLSRDGNTALLGGFGTDSLKNGAAYIFSRTAGIWTQQGTALVGTGATFISGSPILQGNSVALSADGQTAILGGLGDNNNDGAAWVFVRSGNSWTQQGAKLIYRGTGTSRTFDGSSVSISADGNTAIMGGFFEYGRVTVFTRNGNIWTQTPNILTYGSAQYTYFGFNCAISADASTIIVGAPLTNSNEGAAYIFKRLVSANSEINANYDFDFNLSPNPVVNGSLNLKYQSSQTTDAQISIVDAFGRTVFQQNHLLESGTNQISLDISSLSSIGIFFIQVKCATGQTYFGKFMIN